MNGRANLHIKYLLGNITIIASTRYGGMRMTRVATAAPAPAAELTAVPLSLSL